MTTNNTTDTNKRTLEALKPAGIYAARKSTTRETNSDPMDTTKCITDDNPDTLMGASPIVQPPPIATPTRRMKLRDSTTNQHKPHTTPDKKAEKTQKKIKTQQKLDKQKQKKDETNTMNNDDDYDKKQTTEEDNITKHGDDVRADDEEVHTELNDKKAEKEEDDIKNQETSMDEEKRILQAGKIIAEAKARIERETKIINDAMKLAMEDVQEEKQFTSANLQQNEQLAKAANHDEEEKMENEDDNKKKDDGDDDETDDEEKNDDNDEDEKDDENQEGIAGGNEHMNGIGGINLDVPSAESAEDFSYRLLRERNQALAAEEDDNDIDAEDGYESIRLFVCIDIQEYDGQDDYHERFANGFNTLMAAINQVEAGARFLPWESLICNMSRARATLPALPNGYKKFVYFKNKWMSKGRKWTRIHIAFPTKGDIQFVLEHIEENSDWWEENRFYAHVSPCQGRLPFVIGWLSRSIEVMTISEEFQYVLRVILEEPSLGLLWKKIEKDPKARKSLGGTTHGQVTAKKKKGERAVREKMVWAVHIEVDKSAADRTTRRLVMLYNEGRSSYPLSYSVYFVHELEHRVMKTYQGRQGYLKSWTHQQSLMESLYQEHCNIVNIDNPVPLAISTDNITFRQFLSRLTVTSTEGVNGDKLFVAVGRASLEGMTFCFTYHSLAITEAEEVTRNLPLVYEHEFQGNPSDFFEYDLRQQLDGYKWNVQRRQASSPEGVALFQYGSAMVADREAPEVNIETINPLELVTYKRLQGQCDETVMDGVDNSRARAAAVREQMAQPPNIDGNNENDSNMSDLTNATGRRSEATRHTVRTDGSVGTSRSRVAREVDKVNSQWDRRLEDEKAKADEARLQITAAAEKKMELLLAQLKQAGINVPANLTPGAGDPINAQSIDKPATPGILNNSSTKPDHQIQPSGRSANWHPALSPQRQPMISPPAHGQQSPVADESQCASQEPIAAPIKPPPLLLPPLPEEEAIVYADDTDTDFVVHPCSFCLTTLSTKRCYTQVPEKDDHHFYDDAPRCARAYCDSCIVHYLQIHGIDLDYPPSDMVCPYHLLQSWRSSDIASQGVACKPHDDNSLPLSTGESRESGPNFDGAESS